MSAPDKPQAKPENESPPAVSATEGHSKALAANADDGFALGAASDKPQDSRTGEKQAERDRVTYRAPDGRKWAYTGKRGKVLAMLATRATGVTQWDCLPWHTRLGASIHALRCDGLDIVTEREGECRHARYWLCTTGTLTTGGAA